MWHETNNFFGKLLFSSWLASPLLDNGAQTNIESDKHRVADKHRVRQTSSQTNIESDKLELDNHRVGHLGVWVSQTKSWKFQFFLIKPFEMGLKKLKYYGKFRKGPPPLCMEKNEVFFSETRPLWALFNGGWTILDILCWLIDWFKKI